MRKRRLRSCFQLALLAAFGLTPNVGAAENTVPLEVRVFVASKLYASLKTSFVHWVNAGNVDLDQVYKKYLSQILSSESRKDFDLNTIEFLASFHNGHTKFQDQNLIDSAKHSLGFSLAYIDDSFTVSRSARPDITAGDVIESIDGKSFDDFFKERQKYIEASSELAARNKLGGRAYLFPESFALKLASGKTVQFDRLKDDYPLANEESEARWLEDGKIAYVKVPSFSGIYGSMASSFEQQAIASVKNFRNADCIIVDLRNNGGGTTPQALINVLMDKPYRSFAESVGVSNSLSEFSRDILVNGKGLPDFDRGGLQILSDHYSLTTDATITQPLKNAFKGKLIILTNAKCASACEDFIEPFKDNHRATIIGEKTQGSSGQPYLIDFGNGMTATIGAKRILFPDGSPFEGVGISPDIEVETTAKDLRKYRDRALEKAKELAKSAE